MIKKALALIFAVLFISLALVSCGSNPKDETTYTTDRGLSETDTVSAGASQNDGNDANSRQEVTTKDGATVVTGDAMIIKTGDYEIHKSSAEYLTDDQMSSAWYYEYTDTTENPCDFQIWMTSNVSTMTTIQVKVGIINLSDERVMTDLVRTQAVHNSKKAGDVSILQMNPGQTTTDGYQVPSYEAVPLKQGEETDIVFMFDVKKSFLNDGKDFYLKFTIDEDEYIIDLGADLKPRTI